MRVPVEDRDAGDLAAGAGGGRARDVRRERAGHGLAVAERRVDVRARTRRGARRRGSRPSRCRSPSRRRARRSRRACASRAKWIASSHDASVGSIATSSNTIGVDRGGARASARPRRTRAGARTVRSVISATRVMPSARARAPTSASAPAPNVTREASTVKAVSAAGATVEPRPASIAARWRQVTRSR